MNDLSAAHFAASASGAQHGHTEAALIESLGNLAHDHAFGRKQHMLPLHIIVMRAA